MIGVDTNVLLRLFTSDEAEQTAVVRQLLQGRKAGSIRVVNIVLIELVWTLSRRYKLKRDEIVAVVGQLLQQAKLVFESRDAVMTAAQWFEGGNADFADYLIAALNEEAGASPTFTFDMDAAVHPAFAPMQA